MMKVIWIFVLCLLCGASGTENESFQLLVNQVKTLELKLNNLESENKELKISYRELKAENVELKRFVKDDSLEQRVEKLEELSKLKSVRTCQELSNRGITQSGVYEIDPDGDGIGFGPITVYCNFLTNETSIYHDKEDVIKIDKCDTEGCAVYDFNYFAPQAQIQSLIELSESCYQDFNYGCFMAPLRHEGVDSGFWADKNGDFQYFFHGDQTNEHTCQCGVEDNCVDSVIEDLKCNCDTRVSTI